MGFDYNSSLFTGLLAHFTLTKHHFDYSREQVHPHPLCGPLFFSTPSKRSANLFPHPQR
jgi:hypothetical protein